MVLALVPVIAEAGLLIEAARDVIEKRGRNLLALRVLRIALHDAPARLRDQVEGTTKRHTCDAFPSIVPVDEDARDAIVGRLICAGRLVFLPVMDVRELVWRAVLAPGHRGVAVEDQGRMSVAFANETLLPGAAFLALGPADPRMEPGAPAAAEPHALVLLSETRERIPSRGIKRPDRIVAHCTLRSPALVRLTSERVYARPAWHGRVCSRLISGALLDTKKFGLERLVCTTYGSAHLLRTLRKAVTVAMQCVGWICLVSVTRNAFTCIGFRVARGSCRTKAHRTGRMARR